MDLLKAFDCLSHYIFLSKLAAFGLSSQSVKLLEIYLTGRKQQIKLQEGVSGWQILQTGFPLGPLLFSIFINVFFYLLNMVHCTTMLMTTPYYMQIKIIIP